MAATTLDSIKTAKGPVGEQLLQQARKAKQGLTTLRTQFSTMFGPPDKEVKGMEEVEELLGRASENPLYLKLAQQQSEELQRNLLTFGVELSKNHNEALAAAMSLDPNYDYNTV